MEKHTCYICGKTLKYYDADEDPYFNSDKERPDDVAGLATNPIYYHYKTGIFSSESIYICPDYTSNVIDGCTKIIEDLYGKGSTGWKIFNSFKTIKGNSGLYLENGIKEFIDENIENGTFEKAIKKLHQEREDRRKKIMEGFANEVSRKKLLIQSIIKLLKEKAVKMPASDIDAHLKNQDVDEIKKLCEEMYHNGEISRTGNYRYFILTEEKKTTKKAAVKKTGSVADEIKKFKDLLDAGAITQEEYDAKKKELLGL